MRIRVVDARMVVAAAVAMAVVVTERGESMFRRLSVPVAFCLVTGAAFAGEKINFGDEAFEARTTAAFSRAVGALPIDPKDGNQVRVWFANVMNGRVTGYIVVNRGNCSGPHRYPERLAKVMALMREAAKFDGKGAYCDVMDGWQANIEGIVEGKPFAFSASNTNECMDTNEDARQVDTFVDLVAAACYSKDDD